MVPPGQGQQFEDGAHVILLPCRFVVPVDALHMGDQALFRDAVRDDLFRALVQIVAGQRIQQQLVAGDIDGPAGVGCVAVPGVGAEDSAGAWVVECLVGEVVVFLDAGKDEGGELVHPVSLRSDAEFEQQGAPPPLHQSSSGFPNNRTCVLF